MSATPLFLFLLPRGRPIRLDFLDFFFAGFAILALAIRLSSREPPSQGGLLCIIKSVNCQSYFPMRRSRDPYSLSIESSISSLKSGQYGSTKKSSLYADSHSKNTESLCSPPV